MKTVIGVVLFALMVRADVIVMKNGDRVTGDIVKKDGNNVTMKSKLFGDITLPWDQIDSVQTDLPLNVELNNGKTEQAPLATSNGQLNVAGQQVAPGDVKTLRNAAEEKEYERRLHPGWTQLWVGTGTLGWAGAAGNAQTATFTTGFNATRATNTDKTTVYFNSVKASATTNGVRADTAQAVRGGLGYSRDFTKRMFFNGFNDWEYDKFQSLDLRLVLGGGIGYSLIKNERSRLDLVGGLSWNHEKFDPAPLPKFTRNSAEFYWGDDYSVKLRARSTLTQSFRMFHNLSDTGNRRINFDIGANTQLWKWLSWNLTGSDRYLSNPAPGRKTNDIIYSTGFGINFSH
jgi:hypothetical protein